MSKKLVRLLVLLIVLTVAGGVIWSLMQRPSAPAKPAAAPMAAVPPTLEF